jgi:hypothetical protein
MFLWISIAAKHCGKVCPLLKVHERRKKSFQEETCPKIICDSALEQESTVDSLASTVKV